MNVLELLKGKVSEELYTTLSANEELAKVDLGQFIPKARFDEVNVARQTAEKQVKELTDSAGKFADYDELKTKLEAMKDYDELKTRNQELTLSGYKSKLKELGLDESFVDYAMTKIDLSKFDESAAKFVADNPKLKAETFKNISSNLDLNGGAKKNPNDMTDQEYIEYRRSYNLDGTPIKK